MIQKEALYYQTLYWYYVLRFGAYWYCGTLSQVSFRCFLLWMNILDISPLPGIFLCNYMLREELP